jgi:YegS/Rv2252/BmrU family lipid kinase
VTESRPEAAASGPGRAALLSNARARGGHRAAAEILAALAEGGLTPGWVVRVRRPSRLHQAVDWLLGHDLDRLIVGGGDGTLSTVAPRLAGRPTRLGVIPLGTANDFARTVGIPLGLRQAAAVACGAHARAVDMARANDAYFLNVASIGMSVALTSELSGRLKRRLGRLSYSVAGARAFVRHPTFRARISRPGDVNEGVVHQVVVANGRFYGGGVLVARASTLDDGLLTVYALGTRGRWQLLRTVALQKFQVPLDRPGDFFLQAQAVRVETWPPRAVNLDGEIRTRTPVEFAVVPGALRVLTPADTT